MFPPVLTPPTLPETPITEAQKEKIAIVEQYFDKVQRSLATYFNQQPNAIASDDPNYLSVQRDITYYQSAYKLFWFGWDAIEAYGRKLGQKAQGFPLQPGEALSLLLNCDYEAEIRRCLSKETIEHPFFHYCQQAIKKSRNDQDLSAELARYRAERRSVQKRWQSRFDWKKQADRLPATHPDRSECAE